jgi:hypothetical protein
MHEHCRDGCKFQRPVNEIDVIHPAFVTPVVGDDRAKASLNRGSS